MVCYDYLQRSWESEVVEWASLRLQLEFQIPKSKSHFHAKSIFEKAFVGIDEVIWNKEVVFVVSRYANILS